MRKREKERGIEIRGVCSGGSRKKYLGGKPLDHLAKRNYYGTN